MAPSAPLPSPPTAGQQASLLPSDYQYRLDDCEMALTRHRVTRDALQGRLSWTYASATLDGAFVVAGSAIGWRRFCSADSQASLLRNITSNTLLLRAFTPVPLLAAVASVAGLFCLPADLAVASVVRERVAQQERAIRNGELVRLDIIREGTNAAAGGAASTSLIQ
ncbi:hypothetical protein NESM_000116100 [Novymonas esmeraldas]|uniref:Uncharacterized protein n=1 Tax=Novymonas esmeraldas TaxID=1808958 RepID=A0AAW0F4N1_9TRYP